MRKILFPALALLAASTASAQNKIKYYFNHPVETSVSTGVNAININGYVDDTLIAYINRAKYTLDIAVYNTTSTAGNVVSAVNAAYARGVKVRWIYDGSQSNTGIPLLTSGISKLASPTTSDYTIMHNKFMVVDANSANPDDAIVWTGSTNWNNQQFAQDYNNVVILQDSALAHAYRAHFNMMWGDTSLTANTTLSKFGQYKTDLGRHNFTIEGKQVEVYFSPADGTNSKIQAAINTANVDMYFGMYTFTDNTDASMLTSKNSSGVYVAGILDQSSATGSVNGTLSGLGSTYKVYTGGDLYHNKYLVVDAADRCSDPLVLTGSHNWSYSANTKNDENTLIIHDATAANVFYQSFYKDFTSFGGTLTRKYGCNTAVSDVNSTPFRLTTLPNPAAGNAVLQIEGADACTLRLVVMDMTGQIVYEATLPYKAGQEVPLPVTTAGVYMLKAMAEGRQGTTKFVIQ